MLRVQHRIYIQGIQGIFSPQFLHLEYASKTGLNRL